MSVRVEERDGEMNRNVVRHFVNKQLCLFTKTEILAL